jgi:hypothetical protein
MWSDAIISFFINTKESETALDKLQKKFDQTVGAISGAIVGGLGLKSISDFYDETVKLINLSERWNLPVEQVSQFANAFALFGGDAEGAIAAIEKFQQMANSLNLRSSGPLRELSAVIGTNLQRKDYLGVIEAIRSQYQKLSNSPNGRNAQVEIMNMLGVDDIAMQRLLKASNKEWVEILEKARKFGVVNEKSAAAIKKFDQTLKTIRQAFKAIAGAGIEKIIPVFEKLSVWLEKIALLSDDTKAKILAILGVFTLLGPAIKLIGLIFSTFFSPLTLGIAAVAGAIYLLYKNWDKVTQAFNNFLAERPRLQEFFNIIGAGFRGIGNAVKWLSDNFDSWFPKLSKSIELTFKLFKWFSQVLEKITGFVWDIGNAIGDVAFGLTSNSYDYKGAYEKMKRGELQPTAKRGIASQPHFIPRGEPEAVARSYQSSQITNNANRTVTDNRSFVVNNYGVQRAEDTITPIRSIAYNTMTPVKGI